MTRNTIILDIDNCVANDAWRIPYIDWSKEGDERYHIYHSLSEQDENDFEWVDRLISNLRIEFGAPLRFFFLTARPVRYRAQTERWLSDHFYTKYASDPKLHLLMRNNADLRGSPLLKTQQLNDLIDSYDVRLADILFAADDHPGVVAAYKAAGVDTVVHHAIHDLSAYQKTDPKPRSVPELLAAGAETFRERNALYGDNYKHYGAILCGLYPNGLTLRTAEDWNRLALVFACTNKLSRFTWAGGHADSALDLMVNAAMLHEQEETAK